jgi:regulator of protease activity HflC (stomatin/prohibitin superfamily)
MDFTLVAKLVTFVLFVLAIVVTGFVIFDTETEGDATSKPTFSGRAMLGSFIATLLFGALFFVTLGLTQVDAGHVGVVQNFGKVQDATLDPGVHWVTPLVTSVSSVDTRVQPHAMKEIDAASKEQQTVKITGMLNYHVDPRFASSLVQNVGLDFASKVIDPALSDFVKTVVPEYAINDILNKRDELRSRAMTALGDNLAKYHIIIDDIYISNVAFSDDYQKAIESKQVAAQQVQTEQQNLLQKQIQAQQAAAVAQGIADANVITAQGQQKANQAISASLTPDMLQYLLIQKLGDKIQVMYLPTGQNFILNPATGGLTPTTGK